MQGKDLGVAFIYPNPNTRRVTWSCSRDERPRRSAQSPPRALAGLHGFRRPHRFFARADLARERHPVAAGLFRSDWSFGKVDLSRQKLARID
jgi:hypothetical protein